jgi:4-hydroxy-3-polyprenylbenzoate decarboxylase
VARVLDRLGLPNDLMKRWEGLVPRPTEPQAGSDEP